MLKKIHVVGVSDGSLKNISLQAKTLLESDLVKFAFKRVATNYQDYNKIKDIETLSNLYLEIEKVNNELIVLVSGDVNFYSVAKLINKKYQDQAQVIYYPGLNTLNLICAHFKLSYEKFANVSLHGLNKYYQGVIAHNEYTFLLLDNLNTVTKVLDSLQNYDDLYYYIASDLGLDSESYYQGYYQDLSQQAYSVLSVMIIHNPKPLSILKPFYDEDFERNKTPMTKQETRWLITNLLDLKSDDIVYDIGAGSGASAIEIANKVEHGYVYAFEYKEQALEIACKNLLKTRVMNLELVKGQALEMVKNYPNPSKVFIGGSEGQMQDLIFYFKSLNPQPLILISANSIESLSQATQIFKEYNLKYSIMMQQTSSSKIIKDHTLMIANNPIYLIKGEFTNE